ncbi:MAG: putative selenate reductase subunit YgfK [Clostridiales bacterium]|nr:putative selenate reductase subunit YgfK [Clostridiales bacterium]
MSDRMTPISFKKLMKHIMCEYKREGKVFGVPKAYIKSNKAEYNLFGEKMETVFGPAAGPHTQLTQNIVASYFAGSRFFELKTVQKLDGEDLPVPKPCIRANDECYNTEWSTELYIPQAYEEYVKAWFALKVIAKEFELGDPDGFIFNMSVGYDLEGIKTPKIDKFIEGMKNAVNEPIFAECKSVLKEMLSEFKHIDEAFIDSISPNVCRSVTLSTLHGCPPDEIERIATYLITEKHLNTFIKCNPTLLGYEYARKTMDDMGYDYVVFDDFHFRDDLQYSDAIPMIHRLLKLADERNLSFGVKLTNTFPVTITRKELPGNEMYMSGRSLYPLTISVAEKLTKDFDGKLRISFSGGIDALNIQNLFECGIWPITMATTFLKPGGYGRMVQIAENLEKSAQKLGHLNNTQFNGVDVEKVIKLRELAINDPRHIKEYKPNESGENNKLYRGMIKPETSRKMKEPLPMLDCFTAPCSDACPIHQNIPEYIRLCDEGKFGKALEVILEQNPLPFITGTICSHRCMGKCTRQFFESSVNIRNKKLIAATHGYDSVIKSLKPSVSKGEKAAVVGGGPAGMAAAFFLARAGISVTLFEKREKLGGIVRYVIPEFRISHEAIDKDASLLKAMGVEIKTGCEINDLKQLKSDGYKYIILATGAYKKGAMRIEGEPAVNSLEFLERCKSGNISNKEYVVTVGGGNTAMDCARAAKRISGNKESYLVYRRTTEYMPADSEELIMALDDGVKLLELSNPERYDGKKLVLRKMELGAPDESGRRSPVATEKTFELSCDMLVTAIGEKVDDTILENNGITRAEGIATSDDSVKVIGDFLSGPATVVEAIRDAKEAVKALVGYDFSYCTADYSKENIKRLEEKKLTLREDCDDSCHSRCLECSSYCENCVTVCPNRANIEIRTAPDKMPQILHIDIMCNECGNCATFCPYAGSPYLDKLTLFADKDGMENSKNNGFYADGDKVTVRLFGNIINADINDMSGVPTGVADVIKAVYKDYSYLL